MPHVAFCYNASAHETTKYSSFFLMHGTEPWWDVDILLGARAGAPKSPSAYGVELLSRLERAHEITREGLRVAGRMTGGG